MFYVNFSFKRVVLYIRCKEKLILRLVLPVQPPIGSCAINGCVLPPPFLAGSPILKSSSSLIGFLSLRSKFGPSLQFWTPIRKYSSWILFYDVVHSIITSFRQANDAKLSPNLNDYLCYQYNFTSAAILIIIMSNKNIFLHKWSLKVFILT